MRHKRKIISIIICIILLPCVLLEGYFIYYLIRERTLMEHFDNLITETYNRIGEPEGVSITEQSWGGIDPFSSIHGRSLLIDYSMGELADIDIFTFYDMKIAGLNGKALQVNDVKGHSFEYQLNSTCISISINQRLQTYLAKFDQDNSDTLYIFGRPPTFLFVIHEFDFSTIRCPPKGTPIFYNQ